MRFGSFVPDSAGIQEIFKGAAMQAALGEVVTRKASQATSMAERHRYRNTNERPEYVGVTKVLDRTAVGIVRPGNSLAGLDNKRHQTLDAINH